MNIVVFYHAILSSADRVIDPDYAMDMVIEQMSALEASGLAARADVIQVCVNGTDLETALIGSVCPAKAQLFSNGPEAHSEIPTLERLRNFCLHHSDWLVLYHHTKSVSTKNQADNWRKRMQGFLVWDWQYCVDQLQGGLEAVGCHWLTPEAHGSHVISSPFFGGNFWWARTAYVNRLPPLPTDTFQNRYEAESWIGRGNPRPRVEDRAPGWPTL